MTSHTPDLCSTLITWSSKKKKKTKIIKKIQCKLSAVVTWECSFYRSSTVLQKSSKKITLKSTRRQIIIIILKTTRESRDGETSKLIYLSMFIVLTQKNQKELREICYHDSSVYLFTQCLQQETRGFYGYKIKSVQLVSESKVSSLSSKVLCVRKKGSVVERSLHEDDKNIQIVHQ